MHLHTLWSDGTAAVAELLDWVEEATDLDVIAITDHERIDGAQRALELHARGGYGYDLVVGEEVTTRRGHLLGLFLDRSRPRAAPAARVPGPRSTRRAASRSPPTRWRR